MVVKDKADRLIQFIRLLPDFIIVDFIDGNYNHLGATIADAVLQANMKYETHVLPRINRIRRVFPAAATMSGLKKILAESTTTYFLDWKGIDRVKRFDDVITLLSSENIETEDDLRQWLTDERNLFKLSTIKGIGPKTVDYLKILTGFQTCAVDRHVYDLLSQAHIEVSSYDEAKEVLNLAADIIEVRRAYFDHSIWKYMSNKGLQTCK